MKNKRVQNNRAVYPVLASALLAAGTVSAQAQEREPGIEEVTIVGSQAQARRLTGGAHFIGTEELERFGYADIQRILREVPGVSIQVEDGYGLRPNISIRGVATERSGRITLLEDNVLIAPAPYAAPSAYYFPTVGRMTAFEILKGPAAITQGPYTIGGALNMVSTPIPAQYRGGLVTEAGEDATYRVHATYGGRADSGFGFLLETHQWQSDGFQSIDRSGGTTGLDVEDYTMKVGFARPDSPHQVELKLQLARQDSNQSYMGLTDADFAAAPYRRYGLSAFDNIETEHEQAILRYQFDMNENVNFVATAYNNEHARNWFKTEGIDLDGSSDAQSLSRTSWFNVVQAINRGNALDGASPADLQAILDGDRDTPPGSIQLRANDREYYSRGVQFAVNWSGRLGAASHDLNLGLRIHEDEEDRLQRNSSYRQEAGRLVLDDLGILGNAGNRVQQAEALSLHVYDQITFGDWTLTPGLRYEDIDQRRTRFNDGAQRTFRDSRANDIEVWLPGVGVLYDLSPSLSLVAGVHKGFTAPGNSPGTREEEAINYEAGFRYSGALDAEVIGFLSDYDNILGVCTASSGSDCVIGDAFNGEAATVQGLEVQLSAILADSGRVRLPLQFSYTYIDGEFDTDIGDTAFFGDVSAGDPLPYLPENQFRVALGLETGSWAANISGNYVDETCVRASCGPFEQTGDVFTVDLSVNYRVSERVAAYGRIENLTSEETILGRQPYGARPNKDQTAALGLRLDF
ncbi:MAG: TonB-dependent receptor [Pseudohongiellaceae bacterium]